MEIVLAFFIILVGWIIINWLLSFIPGDYMYIKLIVSFVINAIYGIVIGKYIGRRLLYRYLKRIYKNKELTEE